MHLLFLIHKYMIKREEEKNPENIRNKVISK